MSGQRTGGTKRCAIVVMRMKHVRAPHGSSHLSPEYKKYKICSSAHSLQGRGIAKEAEHVLYSIQDLEFNAKDMLPIMMAFALPAAWNGKHGPLVCIILLALATHELQAHSTRRVKHLKCKKIKPFFFLISFLKPWSSSFLKE